MKKPEIDAKEIFIGKCENCKKENVKVRRIRARGMFNEDRGFFNICIECFGGINT